MKKGTTRPRGIRTPILPGHIWGRSDTGGGDAHPIKVGGGLELRNRVLTATASGGGANADYNGFGFFFSGLLKANEVIGGAIFDKAITFPAVGKLAAIACLVPPTADAVFHLIDPLNVQVGAITIPAGTLVGAVVWTPASYTLPANTIMRMLAPASPDTTLSYLNGFVPGDFA